MREFEVFQFEVGFIGTVQARCRKTAEKVARQVWPELRHAVIIVEQV